VTLSDGTVPFSAIYDLASGFGGAPAPAAPGPVPGVPALRPGHTIVYGGQIYGSFPHLLSSAAAAQPTAAPVRPPSLDLDVNTTAGRNVRVRGGTIDLAASGSVLVGGNLQAPTLAGTFTSTRGQVGYFDTIFRLKRGSVTFTPAEGLLPDLDVQAVTNAGDSEINLSVTGPVDHLVIDLSSQPPMSRNQILATLLHAPQVASILGATPDQAQAVLVSQAQSYFNAQLTRSILFPFESLLAQSLNVEQIALIFDAQGNLNLEVRKQITPTVYGIYRSTLYAPVTQGFGMAYALRDYAALEFLQTQRPTGLQSYVADVRFTFH
jgi:hypothetical protein